MSTRLITKLPVWVVSPPPVLLHHPNLTWCAGFTRQPDFVGHRCTFIKVIWRHNWEVYHERCRAPSCKTIIQQNHHVCTGFAFPKLPTDKEEFHQCVVNIEMEWNFSIDWPALLISVMLKQLWWMHAGKLASIPIALMSRKLSMQLYSQIVN